MSRRVVDHVNALTEKNHVFRIQVPYVGFKTTEVEFTRPPRPAGETHYNYNSMIKLAGDSITSSSIEPLRWSFILGLITGFISVISFITFLVLHLIGGIISYDLGLIMISLSFVSVWGAVLLVALGIIGEYVGRTLLESQNRPLYYVDEELKDEKR